MCMFVVLFNSCLGILVINCTWQARFYIRAGSQLPPTSSFPLVWHERLTNSKHRHIRTKSSVLWPSNTPKCVSGPLGELAMFPKLPNRLGEGTHLPTPTPHPTWHAPMILLHPLGGVYPRTMMDTSSNTDTLLHPHTFIYFL